MLWTCTRAHDNALTQSFETGIPLVIRSGGTWKEAKNAIPAPNEQVEFGEGEKINGRAGHRFL
jgi:hypothetical protein